MKESVLIVHDRFTEEQFATVSEFCRQQGWTVNWVRSAAEAAPFISEATIIHSTKAGLIPQAENLRWFSSASAGVNTYLPYLKPETLLTNSAGAFGVSIAEHIIMVALMMLRKMPECQENIARHDWVRPDYQESLYGHRITVVGTGDIGTSFAARVKAFQPEKLIGVSRSGRHKEPFDACYSIDKLDELLPLTDLLVLCVPDTKETRGLMTAERIALLPKTSRLINVGRGTVLDEDALMKALNSHQLAGAALDVFQTEPLPVNSALYLTENLIITPHCSGNLIIDYTRNKNFQMFYDNLVHYAQGEPMEHVVDKDREY